MFVGSVAKFSDGTNVAYKHAVSMTLAYTAAPISPAMSALPTIEEGFWGLRGGYGPLR
jgi:hypothetical protein